MSQGYFVILLVVSVNHIYFNSTFGNLRRNKSYQSYFVPFTLDLEIKREKRKKNKLGEKIYELSGFQKKSRTYCLYPCCFEDQRVGNMENNYKIDMSYLQRDIG